MRRMISCAELLRGYFDPHVVQVSMNVLDFRQTPLHVVFERVTAEAHARGVDVIASELVGMLPADALAAVGEHYLRFAKLEATAVIETRLVEHALSAE